MKTMSKTGQVSLGSAPTIILTVVLVAIVAAVGLLVLNSISTQSGFSGAPAAAISNFTALISNFAVLMPVVGTILAAALIIGVVIMAFVYMRNR